MNPSAFENAESRQRNTYAKISSRHLLKKLKVYYRAQKKEWSNKNEGKNLLLDVRRTKVLIREGLKSSLQTLFEI